MKKRNFVFSIIWIVLGIVLAVCGTRHRIDSFWTGFGGGLLVIGILQLLRQLKYRTDENYREKFDVDCTDERNRYIRNQALASAASAYIVVAALAIVALKIAGRETLLLGISVSVGALMVLYWIFYFYLRAKN